MADETTAKFGVELRDGVSAGATSAEDSLARLKQAILGGTSELRSIQSAMARLKSGGLSGSQAFKDLSFKADALKLSVAFAQQGFLKLGGSLDSLKPDKIEAAEEAVSSFGGALFHLKPPKSKLEEFLGSVGKLPGPLGQVGSRLGGLYGAGSLAALGMSAAVAGAVAVAAAMVTFVASISAATAALFRYGLAQADARRNELLHLEGLVSIRTWFSRTAGSATELQASIDGVSATSAISRSRVAGYAEQLYRAGLRGQTLRDALEGVSTVAAVQGEGMADRFRGMAVAAARTGGSVRRLTDLVQTRLGGTARRMTLSWDRQMERLGESWSELFRDISLDGALESLHGVLGLFEQSTASGRALRVILTSLFQPVLGGVSDAGPALQAFFEGAIIGTQELTIYFLRARNALVRTFGGNASGLGDFVDATTLGQAVVWGFAAALLATAAAVAWVGIAITAITAPIWVPVVALGALAYAVYRVGEEIREFVSGAWTWLTELDWSGIGRDMIAGLVRGLSFGGPAMDAIAGLAERLTGTLRGALDIHSPSRVFAELGRQIPRGLALGVEEGSGTSTAAMEEIASVPQGGALGVGSGRGGSTVYVSIDGLQVVVGSADEAPTGIAERIREELERVLVGLLVETASDA